MPQRIAHPTELLPIGFHDIQPSMHEFCSDFYAIKILVQEQATTTRQQAATIQSLSASGAMLVTWLER